MKICIVHPKVCTKSAKRLAFELDADTHNQSNVYRYDFSDYDLVFNYGSSKEIECNTIINSQQAISNCVDKITTFDILNKHNLPTVDYVKDKTEIPNKWDIIVCRSSANGNRAKELEYCTDKDKAPECELYTEYYEHEFELRIVVFKNKIVGRYVKEEVDGEWIFTELSSTGMTKIDTSCIKAAKALGIDYVGFDLLSKDCEDFVILEANSGATITEEVLIAIRINLIGV